MATGELFLTKPASPYLEVFADDGTQLYVPKEVLSDIPYFQNLFKNNITSKKISYRPRTLGIVFACCQEGFTKQVYVYEKYFKMLMMVDDIHEFLSICKEFNLDQLRNKCDVHFSNDKKHLAKIFGTELIKVIRTFGMEEMEKVLFATIENDHYYFTDSEKIKRLTCEDLLYIRKGIRNWQSFLYIFDRWLNYHQPDDDDLKKCGLDKVSFKGFQYIPMMGQILRKMKKVDSFKLRVYEEMFATLHPYSY